jgi:hypothetical protein
MVAKSYEKKKKNTDVQMEYNQQYLQHDMWIQSLPFADWWIKSHNNKGVWLVILHKKKFKFA